MSAASDSGSFKETRSFKILSSGTMISRYRIIEKIGEGGMGVVYKATDTRLDRTVALKFLPPHLLCDGEARTRFEHEAKAASAITHPNITTIHEIEEVEGQCFISMEYIDGPSLKDLVGGKPLSVEGILAMAVQIGEGLRAAHQKGVIHRDIKSANIMRSSDGVVKIMDFGLAKLMGATALTKTGTTLGTIQYMSPEQAQGKEVDRRSDIFSLGVVLYELITGHLPFRGEHEQAVVYSIVNEPPEPLARYKAGVPEGLQRIMDKALAKDREERYQDADDLLADLMHEKRLLEAGAPGRILPKSRASRPVKRLLRVIVPATIVAAAALLLFIFEPFRIEVGPKKEAVARENSIAIMYFENLLDPEDANRLGQIVTNLLITSLSESRYVNVVSSQRLYDILKLLGREGARAIDPDVATQVATRAGARWMLLGSILQMEPQVILTSQIIDVESGKVVASQRITGEVGEKIFPTVDGFAVGIKRDLSLPAAARKEPETPVAKLTTSSEDAYRYYLEAMDFAYKAYTNEARASYRRALELDSTFAMAYAGLAIESGYPENLELIGRALKYSGRATEAERLYIKAMTAYVSGDYEKAVKWFEAVVAVDPDDKDAFYRLGEIHSDYLWEPERAIRELTRAIEIDPLFKPAHNVLAYTYHWAGDFEKSIRAIDRYISMAPQEANPYNTRGDLYAHNGKLDQAIESYRKALQIKPDFHTSLENLGLAYIYKREYAKAESCYKELSSWPDKEIRSWGRLAMATAPAYQGKLGEALRVLDDGLAADRMEGAEGWARAYKHVRKAMIYLVKEDFDLALKEAEAYAEGVKTADPTDPVGGRSFYAKTLAHAGRIVEAEEVVEAIRLDLAGKHEDFMWYYWSSLAAIETAKRNPSGALEYLEKATASDREFPFYYISRVALAQAYLDAGKLGEAVATFEKILSNYDSYRMNHVPMCVEDHYRLGMAYEKSGWTAKAIEQYREFLEIWKAADPGIPSVEDARRHLARLKQS
jgi:serine/threonine protein kinase/Tfp pilus assembly protein PilF